MANDAQLNLQKSRHELIKEKNSTTEDKKIFRDESDSILHEGELYFHDDEIYKFKNGKFVKEEDRPDYGINLEWCDLCVPDPIVKREITTRFTECKGCGATVQMDTKCSYCGRIGGV